MTDKKTPLYDKHVELGAHMVLFKNTLLPVRFASEVEEHAAVRARAGIFDVSHMGEFFASGPHARDFLQRMLTNDVDKLDVGQAQYSLMLNEQAGIIDDVMVYRLAPERYLLCVNAGNIERDWQHLCQHVNDQCTLENLSDDYAQLALQGPQAIAILRAAGLNDIPSKFGIRAVNIAGIAALVARTGYTGEDGVEIFVANSDVVTLYESLLACGRAFGLVPCGLAARDSLRLEAGLRLHGQDMNEHTTPKDAQLMFAVDKSKNYMGKDALAAHEPQRKLIGFVVKDKGLARHDFAILDEDKRNVGIVTSATYLAESKQAIGFAYVDVDNAQRGTKIFIDIRGRHAAAEICSPRFLLRETPCSN